MKPTKCTAREKKWGEKSEKRGEERKATSKSQDCCVTFKPNSKFCFLRIPELRKLIFCIWIRRPPSVRPVNGFFVVRFSSLLHDSDQKTSRLASKGFFRQNLQGRMVKYIFFAISFHLSTTMYNFCAVLARRGIFVKNDKCLGWNSLIGTILFLRRPRSFAPSSLLSLRLGVELYASSRYYYTRAYPKKEFGIRDLEYYRRCGVGKTG